MESGSRSKLNPSISMEEWKKEGNLMSAESGDLLIQEAIEAQEKEEAFFAQLEANGEVYYPSVDISLDDWGQGPFGLQPVERMDRDRTCKLQEVEEARSEGMISEDEARDRVSSIWRTMPEGAAWYVWDNEDR